MLYIKKSHFFLLVLLFSIEAPSNILDECDNEDFDSNKPDYAETENERVERLNQELMAALNQFDRCLEAVNQSMSSSTSDASSKASSQSTASASASGTEEVKAKTQPLSNTSSNNPSKQDSSPIEEMVGDNGSTPKDIPDASRDDLTMKQMRREAQAAQDPELAAVYWDAFREYVKKKDKK